MTPAARTQAAIDILDDVLGRQIRFDEYFRNWARQHRYAGSKDRAAIKEIVFQVFRHMGELRWRAGSDDVRLLVAGLRRWCEGQDLAHIETDFSGTKYGPPALSEAERDVLNRQRDEDMPLWAKLNVPEWLEPHLKRQFGDDLADEMAAMSGRAQLFIRINTVRTTLPELQADLKRLDIPSTPSPLCPTALELPEDTRLLDLDLYKEGAFEIQDLGSQIAGQICAVEEGMLVVDLAAGAGGKTLQLAAAMSNQGRLIACDVDQRRLDRFVRRAGRAGVECVETRLLGSGGEEVLVQELANAADVVLVDAPCSGSGTWRRRPEARWWLTPQMLAGFVKTQHELLALAQMLVKPGGRLVYVTCSVLPPENQDLVRSFEEQCGAIASMAWDELAAKAGLCGLDDGNANGVQLTPYRHNTDGFFINVLEKQE